MSYSINIESEGFVFQFGRMGFQTHAIGLFIDFEDPKIKDSIQNSPKIFLGAIKNILGQAEEIDALYEMQNFEYYTLQGHGWYALKHHYSFPYQERFKRQAEIVLSSERASEQQIETAKTIIAVLNGTFKFPPPPEKSPEEKARRKFENAKQRLKIKLVIERGHKCDNCDESGEGKLCLIRKDDLIHDYELQNLVLRCRICMNKLKSKSK